MKRALGANTILLNKKARDKRAFLLDLPESKSYDVDTKS